MDSRWVAARLSNVPPVLADVLAGAAEDGGDPEQTAAALLTTAVAQCDSRDGAWPLLGADALISYLCEHALEMDEKPEASFSRLFHLCVGGL